VTFVGKTSMFLSSYVPLFALLAVRANKTSATAQWVFIGLAAVGLAGLGLVVSAVLARQQRRVVVTDVQPQGEQVAAYVASYIIPLATLSFVGWQDDVVLASFILLIGVIYIQSTLIHLNPLLPLFGFRVFRVHYRTAGAPADAAQAEAVIVTRAPQLRIGDEERIRMFGSSIGISR
jgi:hypothetical protein